MYVSVHLLTAIQNVASLCLVFFFCLSTYGASISSGRAIDTDTLGVLDVDVVYVSTIKPIFLPAGIQHKQPQSARVRADSSSLERYKVPVSGHQKKIMKNAHARRRPQQQA